jgi:hypothetical protein
MKKMNGKTLTLLQLEPSTEGCFEHVDQQQFHAALDLWLRRRGIEWGRSFKKPLQFGKNANRRGDDEMA